MAARFATGCGLCGMSEKYFAGRETGAKRLIDVGGGIHRPVAADPRHAETRVTACVASGWKPFKGAAETIVLGNRIAATAQADDALTAQRRGAGRG